MTQQQDNNYDEEKFSADIDTSIKYVALVGLVCLHLFKLPRFLESTAYFQSAKWLLQ
jgi:hypothetical protein